MRLSLSYAVLALVLVAAVSLFSNLFLRDAFVQYVMRQQASRNESVTAELSRAFDAEANIYPLGALDTIGMRALEQGMIIQVRDANGRVLWDATTHNNGMCNAMLESMAQSMQSRYPSFKGSYEEKVYPVSRLGGAAGSVRIGYYGPYYFTDSDSAFIDTLNRALIVIGLLSLLLAGVLGLFMARRISRPISRAIGAAKEIAAGRYVSPKAAADTRELEQLEESLGMLSHTLEEQEMLRRRLTQDIAHELRTPLTALQGELEALIDGVWAPEKKRLESCHEEVLRLSGLVSELEKLARLENHTDRPDFRETDLYALCGKAVAGFEHAASVKGIRLELSGKSVAAEADEAKLRQVLANLLSNSLKYTQSGAVEVRVEEGDGEALITVEDTGIGIDGKDLPYIFERFYRADASRSSRTGGIGVGLAIAKAIVDMHGGRIDVTSTPGQGSAFTIHLPLRQEGERQYEG